LPALVERFAASLIKDALRTTGDSVREALELLRIPRDRS
jgi:hypothetical protein